MNAKDALRKAAEAACLHFHDDHSADLWLNNVKTIIRVLEAYGYKVVGREPTKAMLKATMGSGTLKEYWRVMHDAAPSILETSAPGQAPPELRKVLGEALSAAQEGDDIGPGSKPDISPSRQDLRDVLKEDEPVERPHASADAALTDMLAAGSRQILTLQLALAECERATWKEGQTTNTLARDVRRIVKQAVGSKP